MHAYPAPIRHRWRRRACADGRTTAIVRWPDSGASRSDCRHCASHLCTADPGRQALAINAPGGPSGVVEPPSRAAILRLRAWLATAALPDPPLQLMPGVEAWSPELARIQILTETSSSAGPTRAFLERRYIAARYGPPEIRALAKPHQLPGDPRGPQFSRGSGGTTIRAGGRHVYECRQGRAQLPPCLAVVACCRAASSRLPAFRSSLKVASSIWPR
jgi:hypothetical protein